MQPSITMPSQFPCMPWIPGISLATLLLVVPRRLSQSKNVPTWFFRLMFYCSCVTVTICNLEEKFQIRSLQMPISCLQTAHHSPTLPGTKHCAKGGIDLFFRFRHSDLGLINCFNKNQQLAESCFQSLKMLNKVIYSSLLPKLKSSFLKLEMNISSIKLIAKWTQCSWKAFREQLLQPVTILVNSNASTTHTP